MQEEGMNYDDESKHIHSLEKDCAEQSKRIADLENQLAAVAKVSQEYVDEAASWKRAAESFKQALDTVTQELDQCRKSLNANQIV